MVEHEVDNLEKNNQKLNNAAVITFFTGMLQYAKSSFAQFTEKILGPERNALFKEEMAKLDELSTLLLIYEEKKHEYQLKHKELDEANKELERLLYTLKN
jgi:hypothetical protein